MLKLKNIGVKSNILLSCLLLGGCASSVFPDFKYDNQVIIDDGGRIEVRKVDNKGILVSDKANAQYDDEKENTDNSVLKQENKEVKAEEVKVKAEEVKETKEKEIKKAQKTEKTTEKKSENVITIEKAKEKAIPAKVQAVQTEPIKPSKQIKIADEKYDETKVNKVAEKDAKKEKVVADNAIIKVEENKKPEIKKVVKTAPSLNYLATTIYFENGGAEIYGENMAKIRNVVKIAKDNNAKINVFGFASSRTRDTDPATHKLANFNISVKRAENTVKALVRAGISAKDISFQALSDTMPLYLEVMPEGERLNRRAEIYLSY